MFVSQGKTDCMPIEVGYDESRIVVLNELFERIIQDKEILCATYCITRKGKIIAHNGIGKQSYREDDDRAVQPDAIQYIASITKIFTAVAVMKLVEDGWLRLDQHVCDILPQFKKAPFNQINIFQLLTHTSGMCPDGGTFPNNPRILPWELIRHAYDKHKPEDGEFDWIAASLENGVRMEAGKEWAYSSFGFVILGAVIEKVTGVSAETYIEEQIAKPLGMVDTTFSMDRSKKDRWIVQGEHIERRLNDENENQDEPWSKIPMTGGGLNSTVYDLSIFGNCLLNHGTLNGVRIIGKKALEKMTTLSLDHVPDYSWGANTTSRKFGIGFDMKNDWSFPYSEGTFNHEGAGRCALYIDPVEELVAAWIVPETDDTWRPTALFNVMNVIWSGIIE